MHCTMNLFKRLGYSSVISASETFFLNASFACKVEPQMKTEPFLQREKNHLQKKAWTQTGHKLDTETEGDLHVIAHEIIRCGLEQ